MKSDLFDPVDLGDIRLNNRIAMAPLTRSRVGSDGVPTDLQATYYAQRATAGLIIAEATNISPQARGYAFTPGIWNANQVRGWQLVTKAVHAHGGKIVCQLWHVGRFSHTSLQPNNGQPVAPSAIRAQGKTYTELGFEEVSMPRSLETDEIVDILNQYENAARMALAAGFDGVEVHSANSYLLDQFIRDSTNLRTDRYGGSAANRIRLTFEVVERVVSVWGAGRVGIRLSPTTPDAGNTATDSDVMGTYGALIDKIADLGLAYMHFVEGATAGSRDLPPGVDLDALRARFHGPYVANNGYTRDMALAARANGTADVIAFGRPFIANPDLIWKLQQNLPLLEASHESYYGGGSKGYTDWPTPSRASPQVLPCNAV